MSTKKFIKVIAINLMDHYTTINVIQYISLWVIVVLEPRGGPYINLHSRWTTQPSAGCPGRQRGAPPASEVPGQYLSSKFAGGGGERRSTPTGGGYPEGIQLKANWYYRFSTINASTATGPRPESMIGLMSISLMAACSTPMPPTLTTMSAS